MIGEKSAKLLFETAKQMNLEPAWISEHGLISIRYKETPAYIFYSNSLMNSQLANSLSRNKYLTRLVLKDNQLPNIPFTLAKNKKELTDFLQKHKKVIAKLFLEATISQISK